MIFQKVLYNFEQKLAKSSLAKSKRRILCKSFFTCSIITAMEKAEINSYNSEDRVSLNTAMPVYNSN